MGTRKTDRLGRVDVDAARDEVGELFGAIGEALALAEELAAREAALAAGGGRRVQGRFAALGEQS